MSRFIIVGLILAAAFAAAEKAQAYINYPWCINGDARGVDCSFRSKEECARSGRGRGFGSQCRENPSYNPALPFVVEPGRARPLEQGQIRGNAPRR